jgi:SOS-response transcriptional repressor LexA
MQSRLPKPSFYAYLITAICFSIQALGVGTYISFGVFFNPLMEEFGWSRAAISGASSTAFFCMGIFGVVIGRLNDLFGPRRLMSAAALMLGLGPELLPQSMPSETHSLPIIGEIAAGGPIEAYQDVSETLAVPDILAPAGEAYVLRVRGDSMIEAHIADGDFVVIRQQDTARDGDIVVAQVEENAVTLKRFFREKDRIRLQPANPNYPPQFYPSVRIQGKLIGVIRRLD